jgi:tetratricopeptide (TPR) repeat protein
LVAVLRHPVWLLVFVGSLGLGCAHGRDGNRNDDRGRIGDEAEPRELAVGDSVDASESLPPVRVIDRDGALGHDPGAETAQRRASQQVVEEGKGYLIAGQPREAVQRLQRAVRIDPTNGIGYYHLGRAYAALGDRERAIGVLEKADSLLGPYPYWRARVVQLMASLEGDDGPTR